jgi:hypothetical protein
MSTGNKAKTASFITEIPLRVSQKDETVLLSRFEAGRQLYNACLGEALRRLNLCRQSKLWTQAKQSKKKTERNNLFNQAKKLYQFSEYDLHRYATPIRNSWLKIHLDAHTAQKLATRAYKAVEKILLGKAKKVRFKGKNQLSSLEGKSNQAGIRWKDECLNWSGLKLKPLVNKYDPVIIHGLTQPVKYCRLVRRVINGQNRFYVQLINEGLPFPKPQNTIGHETVGIDVGTSTVAIVGETQAKLCQFCDELNTPQKKIRKLQRKLDRQRRANHKNNYDEKGRVKKGAKNGNKSNRQKTTEYQLANLHRKSAAHRKSLQGKLVNEVFKIGNNIKLEKVSYKGWQRRYGKSIGLRAPSMFVSCLLRKAGSAAVETLVFSTAKTALSQTCQCGCKAKKSLSKRVHKCDCGVLAQRDLYSAFLARFVDKETELLQAELARTSWNNGAELLLRRAWNTAVNNLQVDGRVPSSFGIPPESERVVSKVLVKPTKMSDVVALCESRQEVGGQEPPPF